MRRLQLSREALRMLLTLAGFAFLCAAAWWVAVPFGLAAVGVSLLVLEWLTDDAPAGGQPRRTGR